LIANQQLRRRLAETGGAPDSSGVVTSPHPLRHDS
jgi:hypothetical protein